jgi:hypothetical protein
MGCLRRLGCLILLAVLAGGTLWITSDRWRPLLPDWVPGTEDARAIAADTGWVLVTPVGATRAEHALAALRDPSAKVYTVVSPADFAGYVLMDLTGRLPPEGDSTEAVVIANQLRVRTSLDIRALGGQDAWEPVFDVIGTRAPLVLSGTFDIVRPGIAGFRVQELSIHGVSVPGPMIPRLLRRVDSGLHPAGMAANALLVNVPAYVADIRAASGKILIYKSEP